MTIEDKAREYVCNLFLDDYDDNPLSNNNDDFPYAYGKAVESYTAGAQLAIPFAEWCSLNGWRFWGETWIKDGKEKTTSELFTIFLNQQP